MYISPLYRLCRKTGRANRTAKPDRQFGRQFRQPFAVGRLESRVCGDGNGWNRKIEQARTKLSFEKVYLKIPAAHQPFCLFSAGDKLYMLAFGVTEESGSCFLYTTDAEGQNMRQADITEAWNTAFGEEGGAVLAAADANELVYIGAKGTACTILVAAEDGSMACLLRNPDCTLYDFAGAGGQVYGVGRQQGQDTLFRVDSQKQELETVTALPDSKGTALLRPGPDGNLLYGYYDAIYQYDPQKGEGQNVYAWADGGLDGRNIRDFFMSDPDNLWVLSDLNDNSLSLMRLRSSAVEPADEAAVDKETVLICGNPVWDTELKKAVGRLI